jgi:hypothetical protein
MTAVVSSFNKIVKVALSTGIPVSPGFSSFST